MGIIKTESEIEKMRAAASLGDSCFEYVCKHIEVGMTEKEIAKQIDEYMTLNGASALSFDTIVGSGINSSFIHSIPTDRKIEKGDIILLDFGCVLDGYCSDTSRTIFVGYVKEEYRKIYDIVKAAQQKAIDEIVTGMTCKVADGISREYIKVHGYDFAHALGHGVGIEVHEEPTISEKYEDTVLKDNMVFSIEPGIYIEGQFGIRIEDTVFLKDGKIEVLSKAKKEITIV